MARYRKKKSLYEVIGRSQLKPGYGKKLEKLHPEKGPDKDTVEHEQTPEVVKEITGWPKKPKIIQFNSGRIEILMPYQLAIAVILGIILLSLIFFRLGQLTYSGALETTTDSVLAQDQSQQATAGRLTEALVPVSKPRQTVPEALERTADEVKSVSNRIVIQEYHLVAHLEPVKKYFAGFGIETEIVKSKRGSSYLLVTNGKYDNPSKKGTDGYKARQRIAELGAAYKAPAGYETFGKQPFHDAYGMKFED